MSRLRGDGGVTAALRLAAGFGYGILPNCKVRICLIVPSPNGKPLIDRCPREARRLLDPKRCSAMRSVGEDQVLHGRVVVAHSPCNHTSSLTLVQTTRAAAQASLITSETTNLLCPSANAQGRRLKVSLPQIDPIRDRKGERARPT